MKKIILIFSLVLLSLLTGCLSPRLSRPKSDVPVISNIGWWSYQKGLMVEELEVKVLKTSLNLFNNKALVRFRLRGKISYPKGYWRPFVKETQISERFSQNSEGKRIGNISMIPVIGVKKDKSYQGEEIPFDYKVEKVIQTFGWGLNRYIVKSQKQSKKFELWQKK